MRNFGSTFTSWLSIILIVLTTVLLVFQLISYSRIRSNLPPGSMVGDVPVGGLDRQEAADRLIKAYSIPVEVHYGDAVIQIKPASIGFRTGIGCYADCC